MIEIAKQAYAEMVAAALDAYPYEACGLIAGPLRFSKNSI